MAAENPAPDELDDLISQTLGELDEEPAPAPKATPADPKAAASDLKACVDELKAPAEPNQEELLMNMLKQFEKPEFRQQMEQAMASLGVADSEPAAVPPVAGAGYPAAGGKAGEKQVQGPKTQAESQQWDNVAKELDGMVEKARNEMQVDENMRALIDKFEVYMKENADKLEPSERERYAKQLTIYKRIEELSKGKDDQQTPELFTLLGQLHALGDPPKEIATAEDGGGAGGDMSDEEMKQHMEFLGKMAEYGQQGEAGIEKLVTEMAPEMDKMMEELLKNAPPDAQKAAEQVSEECKQQ